MYVCCTCYAPYVARTHSESGAGRSAAERTRWNSVAICTYSMYIQRAPGISKFLIWIPKMILSLQPEILRLWSDSRCLRCLRVGSEHWWLRGSVGFVSCRLLLIATACRRYSLMRLLRGTGAAGAPAPCEWWVQPCTQALRRQAASAVSGGRAWCGQAFSRAGKTRADVFNTLWASGWQFPWRMYRVTVSCSSRAVFWLYCMLLCSPQIWSSIGVMCRSARMLKLLALTMLSMLMRRQLAIQCDTEALEFHKMCDLGAGNAVPVPPANLSTLDLRTTNRTSDLSGFSSIPFSVNQSLTAVEHSSSVLMSDWDLATMYGCVSSTYWSVYAVWCDDVSDGWDIHWEEKRPKHQSLRHSIITLDWWGPFPLSATYCFYHQCSSMSQLSSGPSQRRKTQSVIARSGCHVLSCRTQPIDPSRLSRLPIACRIDNPAEDRPISLAAVVLWCFL